MTNCWNCGSLFIKASGKHEKCTACQHYKCPRCGRCAAHCNYDKLNHEFNRWHKRNCQVCSKNVACPYLSKARDKKYMFDRINQGTLKASCKAFERRKGNY